MWQAAAEEVARQSCALLGQAAESPLLVSVAAGATVLPMLLKVSKMKGGAIDFQVRACGHVRMLCEPLH